MQTLTPHLHQESGKSQPTFAVEDVIRFALLVENGRPAVLAKQDPHLAPSQLRDTPDGVRPRQLAARKVIPLFIVILRGACEVMSMGCQNSCYFCSPYSQLVTYCVTEEIRFTSKVSQRNVSVQYSSHCEQARTSLHPKTARSKQHRSLSNKTSLVDCDSASNQSKHKPPKADETMQHKLRVA